MSQSALQTIIIAILSADALFAFIQFLIQRHDRKKDSPEKRALKNLLARMLMIDMKEWLHSDTRTPEQWEIIHNNYESYSELGGNGKVHKLYDECKELNTTA